MDVRGPRFAEGSSEDLPDLEIQAVRSANAKGLTALFGQRGFPFGECVGQREALLETAHRQGD